MRDPLPARAAGNQEVLGRSTRSIGGTAVTVCDAAAATALVEAALDGRGTLRVAFLNAHLANCAAADPGVARALAGCLVLNDGIGVDLASRLLHGRAFPANMNGTDFVPALLDRARPQLRLFLLGGTPAVAAEAAAVFARRWPGHRICGHHHGYFAADEAPSVAVRVAATRPDLVLVGMGCPRQELWLRDHVPAACRVGIAVGALFDFETGRVPRAPLVVRRLRFEWLYRLLGEPRRLRRRYILGGATFVARTLRERMRRNAG